MCECLFRCVSVCVYVCCAYRSQPGRQLAIYDLLASLFGFGWCVIAAIGCFSLPPAPPPLTHTHTIHPCWLCAAQSVVVSFFIFHFNLNLFEIRERVSEKMLKFLFWPLPTSQRLNKQRQTSNNNNNTYIGQEHVEEQEQQRASLFIILLLTIFLVVAASTRGNVGNASNLSWFSLNFFCYVVIFHAAGFALVLRLCVSVYAEFVFGQRLQQLTVHSTRLITHAILLLLFVGPYYIPYYSRLHSYTHTQTHTHASSARDCALSSSAARIL